MATTITAVQGDHIVSCILIDLTLDGTTYYISNAYKPVTFNSNTYTELGSFLAMDAITDDIKTTNGDLSISLSGIPSDADYMNIILTSKIKGGEVIVRRGFMDKNDLELDISQVFTRYSGIITNFAVTEDVDIIAKKNSNSITITVASLNQLLQNKVKGQFTNPEDRKRLFANDQIFDRIPDLQNLHFDFGKEFTSGGNYGGGGGRGRGGGGGGGGGRSKREIVDEMQK